MQGHLYVNRKRETSRGEKFFYKIKDMDKVLKLGITKGTVIHIKGLSSFTVQKVIVGLEHSYIDVI